MSVTQRVEGCFYSGSCCLIALAVGQTGFAQPVALRVGHFPNITHVQALVAQWLSLRGNGRFERLFAFNGLHAYANRRIWTLLETKLTDLRATGASSINILDAGCSPGIWLHRLVTRAQTLGLPNITTRGFDDARHRFNAHGC
jgi:hypothetical protein